MKMKMNSLLFSCFLAFSCFHFASTQQNHIVARIKPTLVAPSAVFSLPSHRGYTFRSFLWSVVENAQSYVVRIYRTRDGAMAREIADVIVPYLNVTGLESGTNYTATVTAVAIDGSGRRMESRQSSPYPFKTESECTGGRVYLPCSAHCISSCADPNPICSRICSSGCGCPLERPFWENGKCITQAYCPPARGGPEKPENLMILSNEYNAALLAWNEVKNVEDYQVTVSESRTGEVVQTINTSAPIVSINRLIPGVTYQVAVAAVPTLPVESNLTRPTLPPREISVSNVGPSSFRVNWSPIANAKIHVFSLYNQNGNPIYVKENFRENSIVVKGLASGSNYFYSIASAYKPGKYGAQSALQEITTAGHSTNNDNFHAATVLLTPPHLVTSTTAQTTVRPFSLTRCQQLHASVVSFYNTFPGIRGPSYPVCDDNGYFVTTKCENSGTGSSTCWCIGREKGKKIPGSDFGAGQSNFTLDCDRVGRLATASLQLQARNLSSTSLELQWTPTDDVLGYVLVIDTYIERTKTVSVEGAATSTYQLRDLPSGQQVSIGIFAVNREGWSSSVSTISTYTALLDQPHQVVVRQLTARSVHLSWKYSGNAGGFLIRLFSSPTSNVALRSIRILDNTFTLTDLHPSRYTVEISEILCDINCENPNAATLEMSPPAVVDVNLQCHQPVMDILFAFDTSLNSNLQNQQQLAENLILRIQSLNRESGSRIAAIKYNRHTGLLFDYNQFDNNAVGLIESIQQVRPTNATPSRAGLLLNYIRTRFFNERRSEAFRTRPNAVSVVIVLSGGPATDAFAFDRVSSLVKAQSNVITVKVNSRADNSVLDRIASRPDLSIDAVSQNGMDSVANIIIEKLCTF